jgi:hypothetical protein
MRNGFVSHTAGGAIGGAVGTLFLMQTLKQASEMLPEEVKPAIVQSDAGEFIVSKLEQLSGLPLSRTMHVGLTGALHWAYGIGWGSLLGLATAKRHSVRSVPAAFIFGGSLGALVWAVGYSGWLPAAKLKPVVRGPGSGYVLASLLGHIAYGVVSAVPLLLIDRRHKVPVWRRVMSKLVR